MYRLLILRSVMSGSETRHISTYSFNDYTAELLQWTYPSLNLEKSIAKFRDVWIIKDVELSGVYRLGRLYGRADLLSSLLTTQIFYNSPSYLIFKSLDFLTQEGYLLTTWRQFYTFFPLSTFPRNTNTKYIVR